MARVKIDTPGVSIEIDDDNADAAKLGRQALRMFKAAGGWPVDAPGPAIGFQADRRWSATAPGSSMWDAPPVRVQEDPRLTEITR